jgi:MFS family permease
LRLTIHGDADKLSLNYASAYSLIPDLGLEGQRYSWVAAIFNFGYLFWAIPANLLIQKLPVAKYMGGMILIWSVIVIAHIGAKNYAGILVLRFLLGMAEAGVSPCSKCYRLGFTYYEKSHSLMTDSDGYYIHVLQAL